MEFILGLLIGLLLGLLFRTKQKTQGIEHDAPEVEHRTILEAKQIEEELVAGAAPVGPHGISSLDSVSLLLYFGAFLMVAGVGLFVGQVRAAGGVVGDALAAIRALPAPRAIIQQTAQPKRGLPLFHARGRWLH